MVDAAYGRGGRRHPDRAVAFILGARSVDGRGAVAEQVRLDPGTQNTEIQAEIHILGVRSIVN